jgi:hypothetical protein
MTTLIDAGANPTATILELRRLYEDQSLDPQTIGTKYTANGLQFVVADAVATAFDPSLAASNFAARQDLDTIGELADAVIDNGSSSAGSPIVRAFPFAFDTPGLLTGHAVYTPTIGDILLDVWIEVDTAWNGTTPTGDVGTDFDGGVGWFSSAFGSLDMTVADAASGSNICATLLSQSSNSAHASSSLFIAWLNGTTPQQTRRALPAKIVTADPIKVCVTQDGMNTGADPGSTQGSAVLYLVTATPATA